MRQAGLVDLYMRGDRLANGPDKPLLRHSAGLRHGIKRATPKRSKLDSFKAVSCSFVRHLAYLVLGRKPRTMSHGNPCRP